MDPQAHLPRGEFAILLGTSEKSPPEKKKQENRNCHFSIGSGHIHLPIYDSDVKLEGESSSESKIEKKLPIISNEYSLNILKGEANDHFFEGESPFKKARRFEQEVHFKILQNESNNDPQKTGGKI